ncbi:MAG: asparagine synthase (glutamine-hydrolyzing) [Oligoflexia bacterium]|nr:asparagine synthase (glutamine-hydrolyzing) [Oligoflexia bacterium]
MCGISGFFSATENFTESEVKKITALMKHRGPDSDGAFCAPHIALGHRRLRIIDLSTQADQPFVNESKTLALVYNGEVYNFKEIKLELEALGCKFKTTSDTEVVFEAFQEWGVECFNKFNGMFAIGVWDNRNKDNAFYLARDRYGIKPLFYSQSSGKFAFASELKVLLELPWVDKTVNPQTLFYYIKLSHVPNPLSIVNGVKKLAPGTYLKFCNNKIEHFEYRTDLPNYEIGYTEDEAIQRLEDILAQAVKRHLVSDVEVGCFLSGGIDSSLIAATCTSLDIKNLKTFSIGYKEKDYDENVYAEQVSKILGTKHLSTTVGPSDYFEVIKNYSIYFDQPFGDPTALSSLLLSQRAAEHVKVVLSGDGGDELFFGYTYQSVLKKLKYLLAVPGTIRKSLLFLIPDARGMILPDLFQKLQKAKEILGFNNIEELFFYFLGTIGPMKLEKLASLIKYDVHTNPDYLKKYITKKDISWEKLIEKIFIKTFLVDTVLQKADRSSMAFSLEARVPFLDNEMVDFATSLPFELKFKASKSKYLLRRLMAKKVSSELANRKKQGFAIPIKEWLRGDLKKYINEYLDYDRIKREGHFNPNAVHKVVNAHLKNYANYSHLIWSLLSFQMWQERYLK